MAARYPEDNEKGKTSGDLKPFKCTLKNCPKAKDNKVIGYASRDSVLRHVGTDHKGVDEKTLDEFKKSLPTVLFTCEHCGTGGYANLRAHKRRCDGQRQQAGLVPKPKKLPGTAGEGKTNNDFLEAFRKRLETHGSNLAESTITDYMALINKMIEKEVKKDPSFSPWCWVTTDEHQWKEPGAAGEYTSRSLGASSWKKMICAQKALIQWGLDEWAKKREDPETRMRRLLEQNEKTQKDIGRGRFKVGARQGNQEEERRTNSKKTKKEGPRIDPATTERILVSWQQSDARKETLRKMAAGNFRSNALDTYGESDRDRKRAGWFLALQLFLTARGIRTDVVRNVEAGALKRARGVPQECPYCKEKRVFEEHKDSCQDRELSLNRGSNKDATVEKGVRWYTIEVVNHKTKNKGKIHLFATELQLQAIRNWLEKWFGGLSRLEDDFRPFEKLARWSQLHGTLAKFVSPELMQRTMGKDGKSLLISKSFRRYHVHLILKEGNQPQAKLRGIGHTDMTAVRVYEDENNIEFLRAEDAKRHFGDDSDSDSGSDSEPDPDSY